MPLARCHEWRENIWKTKAKTTRITHMIISLQIPPQNPSSPDNNLWCSKRLRNYLFPNVVSMWKMLPPWSILIRFAMKNKNPNIKVWKYAFNWGSANTINFVIYGKSYCVQLEQIVNVKKLDQCVKKSSLLVLLPLLCSPNCQYVRNYLDMDCQFFSHCTPPISSTPS